MSCFLLERNIIAVIFSLLVLKYPHSLHTICVLFCSSRVFNWVFQYNQEFSVFTVTFFVFSIFFLFLPFFVFSIFKICIFYQNLLMNSLIPISTVRIICFLCLLTESFLGEFVYICWWLAAYKQ